MLAGVNPVVIRRLQVVETFSTPLFRVKFFLRRSSHFDS